MWSGRIQAPPAGTRREIHSTPRRFQEPPPTGQRSKATAGTRSSAPTCSGKPVHAEFQKNAAGIHVCRRKPKQSKQAGSLFLRGRRGGRRRGAEPTVSTPKKVDPSELLEGVSTAIQLWWSARRVPFPSPESDSAHLKANRGSECSSDGGVQRGSNRALILMCLFIEAAQVIISLRRRAGGPSGVSCRFYSFLTPPSSLTRSFSLSFSSPLPPSQLLPVDYRLFLPLSFPVSRSSPQHTHTHSQK